MDSSTITIILALIGILKGKDIWEYLKSRNETKNKGQEKIIEIYELQIEELKTTINELKNKIEILSQRLEKKTFKSRGKKTNESNI